MKVTILKNDNGGSPPTIRVAIILTNNTIGIKNYHISMHCSLSTGIKYFVPNGWFFFIIGL